MDFSLTILGSTSGKPTSLLHQSAYLLKIHNQNLLIECGEATQMQMFRYGIPFMKINHLFISHLHADHFTGLIGLLNTYALQKRSDELNIYAPSGIKEIIETQFRYSKTTPGFPLNYHTLNSTGKKLILDENRFRVFCFPLHHRIECYGFLFREKTHERNIMHTKVHELSSLPVEVFNILKTGKQYEYGGKVYLPEDYTHPAPPVRSFAFITDTLAKTDYVNFIKDVDLLFHEATFSEEHKDIRLDSFHSTAMEAGKIAREANAKKLIIGHFSTRYSKFDTLLSEAKQTFENTIIAEEGLNIEIELKKRDKNNLKVVR